jgi:hypothetical protein
VNNWLTLPHKSDSLITATNKSIAFLAAPFGLFIRAKATRNTCITIGLVALFLPALILSGLIDVEAVGQQATGILGADFNIPAIARALRTLDPLFASLCLAFAFLIIASINRAWVADEDRRDSIVRLIAPDHYKADDHPDLRNIAVISAFVLVPLFPLWFAVTDQWGCTRDFVGCIALPADTTTIDWSFYALDNYWRQLLFGLPDAYGLKPFTPITETSLLALNLKVLMKGTVSAFLISGLYQWFKITRTAADAVTVLSKTPDRAARIGLRIIPALKKVLRAAPDRHVDETGDDVLLQNAATALGSIGGLPALEALLEIASKQANAYTRRYVAFQIGEVYVRLLREKVHIPKRVQNLTYKLLTRFSDAGEKKTVRENAQQALKKIRDNGGLAEFDGASAHLAAVNDNSAEVFVNQIDVKMSAR